MIASRTHVFITGASSGIGRAFAKEMAPHTKRITLQGRNLTELQQTKSEVTAINSQVRVDILAGDLTQLEDRSLIIEKLKNQNLDMVILNAGGGAFGGFLKNDWSTQKQVIALNVEAPTHLAHGLIPELIQSSKTQNKKSALMIVSSHAAFIRTPYFAVYGACKSFLNYLGLTLRQELDQEPIDLLVVCPGATQTQFSKRAGLPQKMISTPKSPEEVALSALAQVGRCNGLFIVAPFDRIIYVAGRILPMWFFDLVVRRLQKRLLKSHGV